MNLTQLLPLADGWETLAQGVEALRRGRRSVLLEGIPVAAKGFLLARLRRDTDKPLLVITYSDEQAARLAEDLGHFLPPDETPLLLPSSLSLLLDDEESGRDVGRAGRRMAALTALANGEHRTVVANVTAILQKTPPPDAVKARRITLSVGDTVNLDMIAARLTAFGYSREDQVNLPGSFARRGDILDVFPSDSDTPVRIDLFGDDIESIRLFDRETQRSHDKRDSVTLVPAHEVAFTRESMARAATALRETTYRRLAQMEKAGAERERIERLREAAENDIARLGQAVYFGGIERYLPLLHPDASCALTYIPDNALVILDEPSQMRSHAERDIEVVEKNLAGRAERGEIPPVSDPLCQGFEEAVKDAMDSRQTVLLSLLARSLPFVHPDLQLHLGGAPAEAFAGKPTALADALDTYVRNNVRVVVVSVQAPRVRGLMNERKIPESPLQALTGPLPPTPSPGAAGEGEKKPGIGRTPLSHSVGEGQRGQAKAASLSSTAYSAAASGCLKRGWSCLRTPKSSARPAIG